jgi:hypothetical protein
VIYCESDSTSARLAPIPKGKNTFAFTVEFAALNKRLWPGRLVEGESLIRGFMTDTILLERPQVDTIRVALIHRWRVDGRMVVSFVCAAFQAIAEHARSDRADDEG